MIPNLTKRLIHLFLSTSFLIYGFSAQAQFKKLKDLFFSAEPSLEAPLNQLNNLGDRVKWIEPSVGYKIQFSNYPGDPSQFLTREALNFRLKVPVKLRTPLSGSLGPEMTAEFIRPFSKTDLPSLSDLKPYGPKKAPHSHLSALRLNEGDFYSFSTKMAFEIGASTAQAQGLAFLGAEASYVVSGDFKVDVYRLSGSKVKVVASSLRQRTLKLSAETSIIPDIEVFGFEPGNKVVNDLLSVKIMDWNFFTKSKGNLFSVSYTYDLESPEGIAAYNQVMNIYQWKNIRFSIENLQSKAKGISERNFWMSDLSQSRLFATEEYPGVTQHSESELDYVSLRYGIDFDLKIAGSSRQKNFMEIDYQLRKSPQEPVDRYRIASFSVDGDYNLAFNFREKEVEKEATLIMSLDEDSNIVGIDELSFHYERTDKKLKVETGLFGQNELPILYGQMRKMLPESLHYPNLLYFENYLKSGYNEGTFVSMDLSFNPSAFNLMQSLTPDEIDSVFDAFIEKVVQKLDSKAVADRQFYGDLELQNTLTQYLNTPGATVDKFFSDTKLLPIKDILYFVLSPPTSQEMLEKQWVTFRSLQKSLVYRDLGAGILVRLLERAAAKNKISYVDFINFRVEYKADKQDRVIFGDGRYVRPDYTKVLLRDRDRVLDRSYDPWHFKVDFINFSMEYKASK